MMFVKHVKVRNYRLLKDINLSFHEKTTIIVGRNNTGKTSLAEIFRSFLNNSGPKIRYEDFNQSSLSMFENALAVFIAGGDEGEVRAEIPAIELELTIDYSHDSDDYGVLSEFIIDLDEHIYEAVILASYRLKDGKVAEFFQSLDTADRKKYFSDLRTLIDQHFEATLIAIDPTNPDNQVRLDFSKFKQLLPTGLINAQRGLDDETHNERDVLGKSLGKIFTSASSTNAPEEFKEKSLEINNVLDELQAKVDTDFQEKVRALLPALNTFGYPGLHDPNLSASTELNIKSLLDSNTRVFYQGDDHFSLPETYSGLGVRNLIFILFRIYEYFREFQSSSIPPKGHLIFIEEPEAHLHPQMQEVFIRQLDKIVTEFQKQFNSGNRWPVQFVVSTHSSHIANEAEFNKVRYFLSKNGGSSRVKDLGEAYKSAEDQKDKEFLHKYLTLTKCDLYFADIAILIEGATERILLPEMLDRMDSSQGTSLRSKYLSVVEVGGAYAHHFYKFIDFLELKTLIITDLDAVKKVQGETRKSYKSCICSEGTHSTNTAISNWFGKEGFSDLEEITTKSNVEKVQGCRRIAYQIADHSDGICGRSFEDAFILANKALFKVDGLEGAALENEVFSQAKSIGDTSKANFAIEYSLEITDWEVPRYIREGLTWLDEGENTGSTSTLGLS